MIKGTVQTKANKPISFPRLMQGLTTGDVYLVTSYNKSYDYVGVRIHSKSGNTLIGEKDQYISLQDFTGSITLQND